MAIKKSTRKIVHAKFGGRCAYCGEEITYKQMQVDHIIPQRNYSEIHKCLIDGVTKVDYGLHDLVNLNPACRVCNLWKSTFDIDLFRSELEDQLNRARKYSRNFRMAERYGLVEEKKTSVKFYYESQETENKTP